jgi:prepilin-type N-terminal cleavage/methylation domain-containing protein
MRNAIATTSSLANQRGFTIIEALTAIVILGIGILALYTMQVGAIQANSRAASVSRLSSWATDRIEHFLAKPPTYQELTLQKPITDPGNEDNAAREFGLNDPLVRGGNNQEPNYLQLGLNCQAYENDANIVRADQCQASPDGRGLVFFNIAPDVPVTGTTTVRAKVVTRDFGSQPVVTHTTYFLTQTN